MKKNTVESINEKIKALKKDGAPVGQISDTYHTFDQLYDHRHALFIALCASIDVGNYEVNSPNTVWKSTHHHDGSNYDGYFIMGINGPKGQISYHLPLSLWNRCAFAETRHSAPEWDGHTSDDVIERLGKLFE